jgi:hypothetical protein
MSREGESSRVKPLVTPSISTSIVSQDTAQRVSFTSYSYSSFSMFSYCIYHNQPIGKVTLPVKRELSEIKALTPPKRPKTITTRSTTARDPWFLSVPQPSPRSEGYDGVSKYIGMQYGNTLVSLRAGPSRRHTPSQRDTRLQLKSLHSPSVT